MANALPFNSIDHDRVYKAEDWAWYFSTFIGNGVFPKPTNGLMVMANGAMDVAVKAGFGFINGYAFRNQDDHVITISISDGSLGRIDRVVLRWDLTNRQMVLDVLQGTPSADPQPVALTRTADTYELALADISVTKGMTTISQSNITDRRTNTDLCGIVEGTVSQIDWATLTAQLNAFMSEYTERIAADYAAYVDDIETFEGQFKTDANAWMSKEQAEFEAWVETIRNIIDETVAGHLQNEIDAAAELQFRRFYGLVTKVTNFTRNADGSIASCREINNDESVVAETTFTRNADGSIASSQTIVTPTEGSFFYTQSTVFARSADGSIASITDEYTKTAKS